MFFFLFSRVVQRLGDPEPRPHEPKTTVSVDVIGFRGLKDTCHRLTSSVVKQNIRLFSVVFRELYRGVYRVL